MSNDEREQVGQAEAARETDSRVDAHRRNAIPSGGQVPLRHALESVVASRIVPALLAANRPNAPYRTRTLDSTGGRRVGIGPNDVADFTQLVLDDNQRGISAYLALARARGISVETIYLDLLTGSARHLGTLWSSDDCNFCEVSMAVWRLQQIMYDLRSAFFAEAWQPESHGYRILLAPMVEEQHTLGTMMAAEFFVRDGWTVATDLPASIEMLADSLTRDWHDAVAISVSGEVLYANLKQAITELRRTSRNPHLVVAVGGWAIEEHPERVAEAGADVGHADIRDTIVRLKERVHAVRVRATSGHASSIAPQHRIKHDSRTTPRAPRQGFDNGADPSRSKK